MSKKKKVFYIAKGDTYNNRHVFETWGWYWDYEKYGWILSNENFVWSVDAIKLIPKITVEEVKEGHEYFNDLLTFYKECHG